MAEGPRYHIPFRRRREGKTNYRSRLALLKSKKPRAVVRKSISGTTIQLIDYDPEGDRVLAQASYKDLKKLGWKYSLKDVSASYLVGLMAGIRAKRAEIPEAVLDIGLLEPTRGNRAFAALKGMVDAGLEIPHSENIFPEEDRLLAKQKDIKGFDKDFETMKSKIMEM
jgi:large subunit ribosomal protein L18